MIPRIHQDDGYQKAIKSKAQNPLVVMPTGSGKTLIISMLCKHFVGQGMTVLVLSHVKEILEQNYEAVCKLNPYVGLYSSMLNSRTREDITIAGIQSVFRKPNDWKGIDIVIIDEAHRCNPTEGTMYDVFFKGIGSHRRIGLTATPFRLGAGYIYGAGQFFDKIVCDWTAPAKYRKLLDLKYLSPLTMKRTKLEMDVKDIKLVGGDFNEKQMKDKFDRIPVTEAAIKEIIAAGKNRKKWLVFAIDIDHAEHIAETLIRNGIKTVPVHSKMGDYGFCRDKSVKELKNGDYQCGVSVNVLTTGFDSPGVDLIGLLRPTNSPALHGQMLGRGTRQADGKENCLVLDFAGNCARLGPIDSPNVTIKGKGKGGGEPILKECPDCQELVPPAVRICPSCFYSFPFEHRLELLEDELLDDGKPRWLKVLKTEYKLKKTFSGPSTVEVSYQTGMSKPITELVCVEHKGFAKTRADHWVAFRGGRKANGDKNFKSAKHLLEMTDSLAQPSRIQVQKKGKYNNVLECSFSKKP